MIVQVAYLVVVDNGSVWRLLVLVHEGIADVCVGRELHHSGLMGGGRNVGWRVRGIVEPMPRLLVWTQTGV